MRVDDDRARLGRHARDAAVEARIVRQHRRHADEDGGVPGSEVVGHGLGVRPGETGADAGREGKRRVQRRGEGEGDEGSGRRALRVVGGREVRFEGDGQGGREGELFHHGARMDIRVCEFCEFVDE